MEERPLLIETPQLLMSASGIELEYPTYISSSSGWLGHVPFAFWLTETHRPGTVVELGLGTGTSFCAFLQAAQTIRLEAKFLGIVESRSALSPDAFDALRTYHDPRYGAASKLVQANFDDALTTIADGSVDLLHVDGTHVENAARLVNDSLPKMSSRGIILLHGVERDRELQTRWAELSAGHPFFSFTHGHGLGICYVGNEPLSGRVELLLDAHDGRKDALIRAYFARLGTSVAERSALRQAEAEISRLTTQTTTPAMPLSGERAQHDEKARSIERDVAIRILRQQAIDAIRARGRHSLSLRAYLTSSMLKHIPPTWKRRVPLHIKLYLSRLLSGV